MSDKKWHEKIFDGYRPSEVRTVFALAAVIVATGALSVIVRDSGSYGWGLLLCYAWVCCYVVLNNTCRDIADREVEKLSPNKRTSTWSWTTYSSGMSEEDLKDFYGEGKEDA